MADQAVLMTVGELLDAIDGTLLANPASACGFSSVATDSRKVSPGGLFVPLMGEFQDGHTYIQKALENGATVVIVDTVHAGTSGAEYRALARRFGAAILAAKDTLRALQDAARRYVARFPDLVRIGITGSSGKTTTKEIVASLFAQRYRVVMNEGNLNSETGLPLSVFKIRSEHEVGVFELGMNRRNEISEIARVLSPSLALITNIGTAHIGILGTQAAIAEEKKSIFAFFDQSGTGFIPEDDAFTPFLREVKSGTILTFGPKSTKGYEGAEDLGIDGTLIRYEGREIRLSLPGTYNLGNALGAISLARHAGLSPDEIKAGIESVQPLFGRAEIIRGEVTVLLDCYNANPDSMESALDFCANVKWAGRKIFVLGSMLELGAESAGAHERVCLLAAEAKPQAVFLFGDEMTAAGAKVPWGTVPVRPCASIGELTDALASTVRPGDLVFIKGSRGMALERVCPALVGTGKKAESHG